jgi:putative transcriptional regulator
MAHHQPPEEMLLDYASGTLPEPVALLVATHLALAPESRRQVRDFEAIGGAMLEEIAPAPLGEDALDSALARLDEERAEEPQATPAAAKVGTAGIPAPLNRYVASDLSSLPWKKRSADVAEYDLLREAPGFRTRLLRIRAGARIPSHTHEGREYTLVLQGSFSDECGCFARGDVEIADSETTHRPVAGPECDCICLAVTDAPLKMTGPLGRVLNYFINM